MDPFVIPSEMTGVYAMCALPAGRKVHGVLANAVSGARIGWHRGKKTTNRADEKRLKKEGLDGAAPTAQSLHLGSNHLGELLEAVVTRHRVGLG